MCVHNNDLAVLSHPYGRDLMSPWQSTKLPAANGVGFLQLRPLHPYKFSPSPITNIRGVLTARPSAKCSSHAQFFLHLPLPLPCHSDKKSPENPRSLLVELDKVENSLL